MITLGGCVAAAIVVDGLMNTQHVAIAVIIVALVVVCVVATMWAEGRDRGCDRCDHSADIHEDGTGACSLCACQRFRG